MQLSSGARLGSYEILAPLGAGGMGEVYRARDPKLEREVAIKVLPADFAADPERLARFEREAKALAALNHPNVATVHGFENDGDTHFLVMELVEGEDLAERIRRGPIPVEEAVPLFVQIAEGLEAAHEKGIVHRDLKPANVKVTVDGRAKVLDFGLAKAVDAGHATEADLSQSPTMTANVQTQHGVLLGTAPYMSPEQARGETVDRQTDVWAFGACLFEALSGRRPFEGETPMDVLSHVLTLEPAWSALPKELPDSVSRALRRSLKKDRKRRTRDIGDVRLELTESEGGHEPVESRRALPWRWIAGAGWATALLFLIWRSILPAPGDSETADPEPVRVTRIPVALPEGVALESWYQRRVAIDPQGRRIAFVGRSADGPRVFVRDLESDEPAWSPVALGETPFFSRDGERVGFNQSGVLSEQRLSGGDARVLVAGAGTKRSAGWGDDGHLYYGVSGLGGINRRTEDGESVQVTHPRGGELHKAPQLLPGGTRLLFSVLSPAGVSRIVVAPVDGGDRTVIQEGAVQPRYLPTGHLVFAQRDTLLAKRFDPVTLESGEPVPVVRGLVTFFANGAANYDVSDESTLVYWRGASERSRRLARFAPGKPPTRLSLDPAPYASWFALSPDRQLAAVVIEDEELDIRLVDVGRERIVSRLTSGPANDWWPVWSADGASVTFNSNRDGAWAFYSKPIEGVSEATRLLSAPEGAAMWPYSWTSDGESLLYVEQGPESFYEVMVLSPDTGRSESFLNGASDYPQLSPDGRWLAYTRPQQGREELLVVGYPDKKEEALVSTTGGNCPRWSLDGRRLFFLRGDEVWVAVVDTTAGLEVGEPELFVSGVFPRECAFDVAADGASIIAIEKPPEAQMIVVQNWFEELKRLVPED